MQCTAIVLMVLCGLVISSHAKENQCPGDKANCLDDSTCCVLSNGSFGCCPSQNAVCCGDSVHCCPDGYTCDVIKARECSKGIQTSPVMNKISDVRTRISAAAPPLPIRYPDGSQCSSFNTCCEEPFGTYYCCDHRHAVCCDYGTYAFCCPHGYFCNRKKCSRGGQSIAMFQKVPAIMNIASDGAVCMDQCPQKSTCCKHPFGTYGCCPLENAVCCSDHKHCCPEGYTCDVETGKCNGRANQHGRKHPSYQDAKRCDLTAQMGVTGNVRLPMLKKAKSPRGPNTQQINLDEKIHFVRAEAHGGDPVTDDD